MEYLPAIGGLVSVLVALPILWKTVIQPGARKIAEAQITGPILEEMARTQPPITVQLREINEKLNATHRKVDDIDQRLGRLERER